MGSVRDLDMRAWGPPEQRRSAGMRGGGWRPRPDAVVDRGAADRSDGSDSVRAAVPEPLAGRPRLSLASHTVGRGTVRCRTGARRRWGGGVPIADVAGHGPPTGKNEAGRRATPARARAPNPSRRNGQRPRCRPPRPGAASSPRHARPQSAPVPAAPMLAFWIHHEKIFFPP